MDWLGTILVGVALLAAVWLIVLVVLWLHRPSRELAMPLLRLLPDVARLVRAALREFHTRPAG